MLRAALRLVDRGFVPDPVVRAGIRRTIAGRLRELAADRRPAAERRRRFAAERSQGPIAVHPEAANAQHYEVPAEFYGHVLGRHRKYSSAFWSPDVASLDEAEARMLALTCQRAGLAGGQRVLELGCGWGALSLWMARHYPSSEIVAVSNSRSQKASIDERAAAEGLRNLEVITADMNAFEAPGTFDRVVSVEMFEHMRNWRALLANVRRWLRDEGRLFVHIFTHRDRAYLYEVRDASDWMAAHFFTGGIMPSDDLLYAFEDQFAVEHHWRMPGTHYQRTAEAWLARMDAARAPLAPLFDAVYGAEAGIWWQRWRVFFMACAELWGWDEGREWLVSHYLLAPAPGARG